MEFFSEIEKLLQIKNYKSKISQSKKFINDFKQKKLKFNHNYQILDFSPSYENFCKIVEPHKVPRRRGFETDLKKATLIHAIVHIEYSAIDLAFDASYRFREMPMKFYEDWIEVAEDEIRHFEVLNSLLNEVGFEYGDIEVHSSLYEASQKTPNLLERMAIVPRWLEANGLDANEKIIQKLQNYKNDKIAKKLINALYIILEEEIPHVQKGDYWFKWECKNKQIDPISTYFEIVNNIYQNVSKKSHLNIKARQQAGFSCAEIKNLSKNEIKCE
jgi:uncharacterized ferritin-like protein (DUF455 family)